MLRSIFFADKPLKGEAYLESIQSNPEVKIPSKAELRDVWIQDPSAKHGIDLLVQLINRGFKLEVDDFNVQADINLIDYNTDISSHLDRMVRDSKVFGVSFGEYLYNKGRKKIVGLWNMDAVKTDFIRDANKRIVLDASGNPEGYIQEIDWMADTKQAKIESTPAGQRGLIFKRIKMYHFSFETFSGTIEGISSIQTIYDTLKNKMEAEKSVKEAIKRFGVPIIKVEIGDDRHLSTPEQLKKVREKLQGIENKSVIVTPHWQKIDIIQPKQISKISDNLIYYVNQIPVGLQIPRALIFETGESVNRATLRQQIRLFSARILKDRDRERDFLVKQLLPFIGKINNWKEIPRPTWQPVTIEDLESYAKRITSYVKQGILSPDDVKKHTMRLEEL